MIGLCVKVHKALKIHRPRRLCPAWLTPDHELVLRQRYPPDVRGVRGLVLYLCTSRHQYGDRTERVARVVARHVVRDGRVDFFARVQHSQFGGTHAYVFYARAAGVGGAGRGWGLVMCVRWIGHWE